MPQAGGAGGSEFGARDGVIDVACWLVSCRLEPRTGVCLGVCVCPLSRMLVGILSYMYMYYVYIYVHIYYVHVYAHILCICILTHTHAHTHTNTHTHKHLFEVGFDLEEIARQGREGREEIARGNEDKR